MEHGFLTQEMITAALDELWGRTLMPYDLPLPPARPRYEGLLRILLNQPAPVDHQVPELDWTVQAGGWRLVIEDGAIRGLKKITGVSSVKI